jgi:drug/metabolite transporter (DMT)-like permease
MLYGVLSKVVSESLLSLYPVFVKNIGLAMDLQLWSRCFSYAVISAMFIDYAYVFKTIFSKWGILLSLITVIHIYVSYRGFELLESGISYSIFYLYPLFILLLAGKTIHPIMAFLILGTGILMMDFQRMGEMWHKETGWWGGKTEGFVMILLAALTEAFIYFVVRNIKTANHWNHIFISYFLGGIVLSVALFDKIREIQLNSVLSLSLIINIVIGLFGYLLRFFAISNLETSVYAPLSYIGIVMAYVYGLIFNHEVITLQKIVGSLMIIVPNIYLLL